MTMHKMTATPSICWLQQPLKMHRQWNMIENTRKLLKRIESKQVCIGICFTIVWTKFSFFFFLVRNENRKEWIEWHRRILNTKILNTEYYYYMNWKSLPRYGRMTNASIIVFILSVLFLFHFHFLFSFYFNSTFMNG